MHYLAKKITLFYIKKGKIEEDDREVYEYSFEMLISTIINFLIILFKYLFLIFIFSCIGCGETNEQDANTIEGNTDTSQITIAPVTNLKAKITQNPNELYLTWTNPITVTNMLGVEIYYKQQGSNDEKSVNTIQTGEGYVTTLTTYSP